MTDLTKARECWRALGAALGESLGIAISDDAPVVPFLDVYIPHLRREEGSVPHVYNDHLGYATIGVGRLVDKRKGGRLRESEIDLLLTNDICEALDGIAKHPKIAPAWAKVKDNPARACAMLSMAFQMGVEGLGKFTTTLGRIAAGDFAGAAASARDSLWARQTPERAARVTKMLETGVLA